MTSRARGCTPNSNSAKARSRSSWRPRRPARASTFSSATSCSTTTFRGTPNRLEQRMGRIHRYGQRKDCLIFNFVATNTIEGRVLATAARQAPGDSQRPGRRRGLQRRRRGAALLPRSSASCATTTPATWATPTSKSVSCATWTRRQFRAICQNALEGLASQEAQPRNADRAPRAGAGAARRPGDHRPFPSRSGRVRADHPQAGCRASRTPSIRRARHRSSGATRGSRTGELPALADRYPRCSTDRETAETNNLEWVTPGHPLFEAIRRHTHAQAREVLGKRRDASTRSSMSEPARIDFYRARVVDGLGQVDPRTAVRCRDRRRWRAPACRSRASWATSPQPNRRPSCPPSPTCRGDGLAARACAAPFLDETRKERLSESRPDHRPRRTVADRIASARGRGDRPRGGRGRPEDRQGPKAGWRRPKRGTPSCWPAASGAERNSSDSGRSPSRRSNGSQRSRPAAPDARSSRGAAAQAELRDRGHRHACGHGT